MNSTVARSNGPPGISFSAYARRRGCSIPTVSRAVKLGRLKKSLAYDSMGKAWIADPEVADREWDAGTDLTTAPPAVAEHVTRMRAAIGRVDDSPDEDVADLIGDEEIPTATEGMTLSEASAIEKRWRAKLAKLEYQKKAGALVEAADIRSRLVDVFSACRTKLLGVPSRARQRLPHLTIDDVTALDDLVREALEELSQDPATFVAGKQE